MAQEKENFLGRWSRLKKEQEQLAAEKPVPQKSEAEQKPPELPPLDKLTPDSDFSGFMHPKVEDALRRAALKKLFADPHFNIPDPFEPYSRDWTVGDPIPDEMMATLNQARTLLFSDKEKEQAQAADEAKAEQEAYAEDAKRLAEAPQADQPGSEAKDDEPRRQDT
jgi:hypothetical protein